MLFYANNLQASSLESMVCPDLDCPKQAEVEEGWSLWDVRARV